ncbi:glycosyltransferase family 2 protein [Oceanicoccus sp. KOV_DT_Chl]|uniref:glycosyltransferase family 2 protein n=1 Tax=Oceanicoccus sp. KOV_DT_Chl TaxID=1904639 RepID=UPI000C7AB475|nr:glycosyltransferase family 2 protein [Oceanicoccus sp. KOV_DT_Chl]
MEFSPCIIIPVYNHPDTIVDTYQGIKAFNIPCLLIDDGSDELTRKVLIELAEQNAGIHLMRLPVNQGKGGAVKAGLVLAAEQGFSHALQIDADGQHDINDVPALLRLAENNPAALVCGQPCYDESVPMGRYLSRYITHFWVCVELLRWSAPDSMCGFRVYPLVAVNVLIKRQHLGQRMDFDTEIMVRLVWDDVEIVTHDTQVIYPQDGRSHFNYLNDNWLITKMHTRLFFGMLYRLPRLLTKEKRHSAHWSQVRERGSIWGIKFLLFVYRLLGRPFFKVCLYPVLAYFMAVNHSARKASQDYLQRVFSAGSKHPDLIVKPGLATSYKHFVQFGCSALDRAASLLGISEGKISTFLIVMNLLI